MRRMTAAVATVALLAAASTAQAVVPADGAQYPRGTAIDAPACEDHHSGYPNLPPLDGDTISISAALAELSGGGQGYIGTISAPDCEPIVVEALGDYLLQAHTVSWTEEWCCGTWMTLDKQSETRQIRFSVVEDDTCVEFTSVRDGRGNELGDEQLAEVGIPGRRLRAGGTLRVPASSSIPKGVEVDLPDGSTLRIGKGSELAFDGACATSQDREWTWQNDLRLVLGKLWLTVGGGAGPEPQVRTERVVAGPRGTSFSVAYRPGRQRTTVHVTDGAVRMAPVSRPKRGILLRAGQTGVQQGDGPVRRVR